MPHRRRGRGDGPRRRAGGRRPPRGIRDSPRRGREPHTPRRVHWARRGDPLARWSRAGDFNTLYAAGLAGFSTTSPRIRPVRRGPPEGRTRSVTPRGAIQASCGGVPVLRRPRSTRPPPPVPYAELGFNSPPVRVHSCLREAGRTSYAHAKRRRRGAERTTRRARLPLPPVDSVAGAGMQTHPIFPTRSARIYGDGLPRHVLSSPRGGELSRWEQVRAMTRSDSPRGCAAYHPFNCECWRGLARRRPRSGPRGLF